MWSYKHRKYCSLLRHTCNQIAGMRGFNYNSITIGKEIKLYIFHEKFTQKKSSSNIEDDIILLNYYY